MPGSCCAERFLELIEGFEFVRDGTSYFPFCVLLVRCHDRPEKRMVEMPAAVIAHRGAYVRRQSCHVFQQFLNGLVCNVVVRLQRCIELVYVSLMMFSVVYRHRLRVYERLQSII